MWGLTVFYDGDSVTVIDYTVETGRKVSTKWNSVHCILVISPLS